MEMTHVMSVCFVTAVLGITVANAVTRDTLSVVTTAATATVFGNTTGSLNSTATTATTSGNFTLVTSAETATISGNITRSVATTAETATISTAATGPSPCSVFPCRNGGTCTNSTCRCTANFTGWYCDIPIKCAASDCVENNTAKCEIEINQQPASFGANCTCKSNYEGEKCQTRNDCISLPCKHGGGCYPMKNNTKPYRCDCKVGDASLDCSMNEADDCKKTPPLNATSYRTCIDTIGSAQLICSPGFKGPGCQFVVDVGDNCTQYGQNCSDEGYCKPLCNVQECNGTKNCAFTTTAFKKMTNATVYCEALFADGYHHAECFSEDMLFDGFDQTLNNLNECSPYFNSVCTKSFGNGKCNDDCNTDTCLLDGGDCSNVTAWFPDPLPGGVVIQFRRPPVPGFHRNLSMVSRSLINATLEKNEAFLKVRSTNFTTLGNMTRFLSGVIGKRPFLVDYVTDVFECPAGLWNTTNKCKSKCGHCVQIDDVCHWSTGKCLAGCQEGYHGDACDKKCPANCVGTCDGNETAICNTCKDGFFGPQCNMPCDKNCMKDQCIFSDGKCECDSGMKWDGTSCACPRGLFGEKCSMSCDSCRDKDCDGSTGVCATGCVDGFFGTKCEQRCHAGCKVCEKSGVCSEMSENEHSHGPVDSSSDNTGVIIGIVVAVLLVLIILGIACFCWRRRGQSGDYPIMDDDEGPVSQGKAPALVPTVVSGMQPPSPMFGRAHEMIDMDAPEGVVVYDGRASSNPVTAQRPPGEEEKGDHEPRQPADGDSEAEPEVHTNNGVKGPRVTSSVTIEVDSRGRMLSITDAELVPSPSMLKHDEEVFTMEEENQTGNEISDKPEVDGGEADTPPQSPLWDVKAPLASEENILSTLGPKLERTLSDVKGDNSSSSGSSSSSRKSSQSSKSSTPSSDNEETTEM
ncbi:cell death abnormality protein 1-like isoform X2 [Dreissena polymorpha]|nr:cell death abnormality protein 1-like isoform X2 [Dreissena polymorpha]